MFTYSTRGTCSRQILFDVTSDNKLRNVRFIGGCSGNLQGISKLVVGMPAKDAIARLRGIRCGFKPTSCPDQLSIALEKALEAETAGAD